MASSSLTAIPSASHYITRTLKSVILLALIIFKMCFHHTTTQNAWKHPENADLCYRLLFQSIKQQQHNIGLVVEAVDVTVMRHCEKAVVVLLHVLQMTGVKQNSGTANQSKVQWKVSGIFFCKKITSSLWVTDRQRQINSSFFGQMYSLGQNWPFLEVCNSCVNNDACVLYVRNFSVLYA